MPSSLHRPSDARRSTGSSCRPSTSPRTARPSSREASNLRGSDLHARIGPCVRVGQPQAARRAGSRRRRRTRRRRARRRRRRRSRGCPAAGARCCVQVPSASAREDVRAAAHVVEHGDDEPVVRRRRRPRPTRAGRARTRRPAAAASGSASPAPGRTTRASPRRMCVAPAFQASRGLTISWPSTSVHRGWPCAGRPARVRPCGRHQVSSRTRRT